MNALRFLRSEFSLKSAAISLKNASMQFWAIFSLKPQDRDKKLHIRSNGL